MPASLNLAINHINTKYFIRFDGDDYVGRDFLLFLYNFVAYNKHMDAVACDYNLIKNIVERMYLVNPNFSLDDIIQEYIKNPNLFSLNSHIIQKTID